MRIEPLLWLLALTQPAAPELAVEIPDSLLVEVVVFARNEPDGEAGAGQKRWPDFAGERLAPYTGDPKLPLREQPSMQLLPDDLHRLEAAVGRLRGAGTFSVLHHHAHVQPLIGSTVRLRAASNDTAQQDAIVPTVVPEYDGSVQVSGDKSFAVRVRAALREPADGRSTEYLIDQSNRIASGETAYFDHRRFGVLVRVERLEADVADSPPTRP